MLLELSPEHTSWKASAGYGTALAFSEGKTFVVVHGSSVLEVPEADSSLRLVEAPDPTECVNHPDDTIASLFTWRTVPASTMPQLRRLQTAGQHEAVGDLT